MIVVVVIPFWVVETSLTTVLDELLPPPDPELLPADCEDEVDDVADVDEVADADDVDDVDDVDDDELAALDGVAVTAAVEDAIALIDMKTSPEGTAGTAPNARPALPFNATDARSRRTASKNHHRGAYFSSKHQKPFAPPRVAASSRLSGDAANGSDQLPLAVNGQSSRLTSM
ncbi:hypothetical protein [Bradyrhizobium genosp. A]|uniref:hypothetical protein n=1 Tax=Bradyrhizobium genosp. A TaxID=83626 RepID=UPI003CF3A20A